MSLNPILGSQAPCCCLPLPATLQDEGLQMGFEALGFHGRLGSSSFKSGSRIGQGLGLLQGL